MRAILFRHRGGFDAQLSELRRLDPRVRTTELEALPHVADADDWVIVRAADVTALRGGNGASYDDVRVEQGERGPSCATYRGHPLALTQLELGLLAVLVRAGGRPVAREVLLRECWKTRTISDFARMEAAVCRLRKKLCASTQLNVQMDRGLGYRITRRTLGEPRPRSRRVLVAEPDLRVRQALVKNLGEFAVDTATTRARTIRLVRDRSYVAAFIATRLRDGATLDLLPLSCPTMMLAEDDADAQRSLDRGASACWQKLDDDPSALRTFARHAASASDAYAEVLSAGAQAHET